MLSSFFAKEAAPAGFQLVGGSAGHESGLRCDSFGLEEGRRFLLDRNFMWRRYPFFEGKGLFLFQIQSFDDPNALVARLLAQLAILGLLNEIFDGDHRRDRKPSRLGHSRRLIMRKA